nr:hypothetical protein Iba_chr02dCG14510 [Ipomoea batatas]
MSTSGLQHYKTRKLERTICFSGLRRVGVGVLKWYLVALRRQPSKSQLSKSIHQLHFSSLWQHHLVLPLLLTVSVRWRHRHHIGQCLAINFTEDLPDPTHCLLPVFMDVLQGQPFSQHTLSKYNLSCSGREQKLGVADAFKACHSIFSKVTMEIKQQLIYVLKFFMPGIADAAAPSTDHTGRKTSMKRTSVQDSSSLLQQRANKLLEMVGEEAASDRLVNDFDLPA